MSFKAILYKIGAFLFDREPPAAAALATAITTAPLMPQAPRSADFTPEPPACAPRVFYHAGQRFERLSVYEQGEAQQRLYQRLKASQAERGIRWDVDEIDMDNLPADFAALTDEQAAAFWGDV